MILPRSELKKRKRLEFFIGSQGDHLLLLSSYWLGCLQTQFRELKKEMSIEFRQLNHVSEN